MVYTLFDTHNFYAAFLLLKELPAESVFDVELLRLLATVTRLPLGAFSAVDEDALFMRRTAASYAMRVKNIREAGKEERLGLSSCVSL